MWVDINDDNKALDDFGDHEEATFGYTFCADCHAAGRDPHRRIVDRLDAELCEACVGSPWPGVLAPFGEDEGRCAVERCDDCRLYATDDAAASALARALSRGGEAHRVETDHDGAACIVRNVDGAWSHLHGDSVQAQFEAHRLDPDNR